MDVRNYCLLPRSSARSESASEFRSRFVRHLGNHRCRRALAYCDVIVRNVNCNIVVLLYSATLYRERSALSISAASRVALFVILPSGRKNGKSAIYSTVSFHSLYPDRISETRSLLARQYPHFKRLNCAETSTSATFPAQERTNKLSRGTASNESVTVTRCTYIYIYIYFYSHPITFGMLSSLGSLARRKETMRFARVRMSCDAE